MATDRPTPGVLLSLWLLVCRFGVAGLLGIAAFYKLQNPQAFANAVKAYKVLPEHLIHVSAFAIPWTEAFVAIALVLGLWTRAAAILSSALVISFIYAIASVMIRSDVEVSECSCFGEAVVICTGAPGWCHLTQDAVLLILSGMVLLWGGGRISIDHAMASKPVLGDD